MAGQMIVIISMFTILIHSTIGQDGESINGSIPTMCNLYFNIAIDCDKNQEMFDSRIQMYINFSNVPNKYYRIYSYKLGGMENNQWLNVSEPYVSPILGTIGHELSFEWWFSRGQDVSDDWTLVVDSIEIGEECGGTWNTGQIFYPTDDNGISQEVPKIFTATPRSGTTGKSCGHRIAPIYLLLLMMFHLI